MKLILLLVAILIVGCSTHIGIVSFNELHPDIRANTPDPNEINCAIRRCGPIVSVDCQTQLVDGPQTYYDNRTGKAVMYCGGACQPPISEEDSLQCKSCPPPEWACPAPSGYPIAD